MCASCGIQKFKLDFCKKQVLVADNQGYYVKDY